MTKLGRLASAPWRRLGPRLRKIVLAAVACLATLAVATAAWIAWPLPADMARPGPVPSVTLLDRHGLPLRSSRSPDGQRGGWIALDEVDPDILRAFLATEDERFYEHAGVDLRAVARAARDNLAARRVVSGASTISMQTARLLRHVPRSWLGKLRQALWALRLDAHLDKQTILEVYLNRLPLGQGAVGVSAAASLYFDASASDVSLGQAAMLASLAHAPSRDNPLVSPGRAAMGRARVLERLGALGYAGPAAIARAREEPLIGRRDAAFLAPHFTTRILLWAEEAGSTPDGEWLTSIDLVLQTALESEVRHTVDLLAEQRARHAAAVVLDNVSGAILAWVGSPDFWADSAGQVDMVVSRRQPGSALKPFLYGLAFDRGYTPASVLPDIPRAYDTPAGLYEPRNYDRRFRGPIRAREALASSYNVPAVELAHRLGVGAFLATLQRAGFRSLDRSAEHYGVGLALGNGDVTLLELANGYRALAGGGVWRPYRWRAPGPETVPLPADAEERVMSEAAASLVLNILDDPVARIPAFGVDTPLELPFPVAAKTGTSRRFTDNWAIGVTQNFTVAVWVGNFSGRTMAGVSGVSGAGPLLQRAILATARRYPPGTLATPADAGLVPISICRTSGLIAGPECPHATEWFVAGSEPQHECDWHRGGRTILPAEYAEWLDRTREADPYRRAALAIEARSTDVRSGRFQIVSPRDGDRYTAPVGVEARYASIALRAVGGTEASVVRWWVDGVEVTTPRWRLTPGHHTIRAQSASGASDEVRIYVE